MRTAAQLVLEAQDIVFRWLEPGQLTERQALDQLVELLDSPDAVAIAAAAGKVPGEDARRDSAPPGTP